MIKKFNQYNESLRDKMTPKKNVVDTRTYEEVQDCVFDLWDDIESFINESVLDEIFRKIPHPRTEDIKKAVNKITDEIIDIWEQTTEYDDYTEGLSEGLTDKMIPKSNEDILSSLERMKKNVDNIGDKETKIIIDIVTQIIPGEELFEELIEYGVEIDKILNMCLISNVFEKNEANRYFNGMRPEIIYKLLELIEENKNKLKDYDPEI